MPQTGSAVLSFGAVFGQALHLGAANVQQMHMVSIQPASGIRTCVSFQRIARFEPSVPRRSEIRRSVPAAKSVRVRKSYAAPNASGPGIWGVFFIKALALIITSFLRLQLCSYFVPHSWAFSLCRQFGSGCIISVEPRMWLARQDSAEHLLGTPCLFQERSFPYEKMESGQRLRIAEYTGYEDNINRHRAPVCRDPFVWIVQRSIPHQPTSQSLSNTAKPSAQLQHRAFHRFC